MDAIYHLVWDEWEQVYIPWRLFHNKMDVYKNKLDKKFSYSGLHNRRLSLSAHTILTWSVRSLDFFLSSLIPQGRIKN